MNEFLTFGPSGLQAFWIWLTFAIVLLGLEVFLGTQWLLWSAAAAGLVAVICLTALPFGLVMQIVMFAVLSVAGALLTRKFLKISGDGPDVNDPHSRMIGMEADVLSGFAQVESGERTGRVIFDGVEWPAVLHGETGEARLNDHDRVIIARIHEGRLYVKPTN